VACSAISRSDLHALALQRLHQVQVLVALGPAQHDVVHRQHVIAYCDYLRRAMA